MKRFARERLVPVLWLVSALALVPAALFFWARGHHLMLPMKAHFVVVSVAGVLATAAAVVLTVVGARRRDGRSVVVGVAFSAMAAILAVHGAATPGILVSPPGLIQIAGGLNLPIGSALLALSALPALRRPRRLWPLLGLQAVGLAVIGVLTVLAFAHPDLVPGVPRARSGPALALLAFGLVCLGLLAWRCANTYLLTRRRGDLLVTAGLVWLGGALYGVLTQDAMSVGFWLAHVFEVGGIALVGGPTAYDLWRGAGTYPLSGDLPTARIVQAEELFLGARVRALMLDLAEKDAYTEEHTRRVSLLAVQLGEELGLSPGRLRLLALGGLLHDIGKLSVPDHILDKPAALDADELAVIQRHPEWGARLIDELGGFPAEVREMVLSHHERLDRKGYPAGVDAGELPIEVRILTVCDVYDALITDRVYRPAWSHERALGLLREESGTAFCVECVAGLERVLGPGLAAAA
ncbi:MAG TPA: HD-GYP domain-containing protein [Gaiellaceae bacterium]|jgi:putative nucleotidyltransferase with HDIG domain